MEITSSSNLASTAKITTGVQEKHLPVEEETIFNQVSATDTVTLSADATAAAAAEEETPPTPQHGGGGVVVPPVKD